MTVLSAESRAKINLFLQVKEQRRDGYHELNAVFLPVTEPRDRINIHPAPELVVRCSSDEVPDQQRNLCWRAATLYAQRAGLEPRWRIEIEKHIPVAAGLGGGSGNAACVLNLLHQQDHKLSRRELFDIAASLGADVPFFLDPRPVAATGKGEIMTEIPVKGEPVFLVISPRFPVSTAWAYRQLSRTRQADREPCPADRMSSLLRCLREGDWSGSTACLHNDFMPVLWHKFPLLEMIREDLQHLQAGKPGLSGSGPTLFLIIDDKSRAAAIKEQLLRKYGASVLRIFIASLLQA